MLSQPKHWRQQESGQQFIVRLAKSCCLTATASQGASLNLPQHLLTWTLTQLAQSCIVSFRDTQTSDTSVICPDWFHLGFSLQDAYVRHEMKPGLCRLPKSEYVWDKKPADKLQQKKPTKDGDLFLCRKSFIAVFISKKYIQLENKAEAFLAQWMSKWKSPNANFGSWDSISSLSAEQSDPWMRC